MNRTRSVASLFCGNEDNPEVSESPPGSRGERLAERRERRKYGGKTADAKGSRTIVAAASRSSRCSRGSRGEKGSRGSGNDIRRSKQK